MDFLPNTDFPDIRCIATIQSTNGSLLLIPREDDLIRLYVHIDEHADLIDEDGRLRNHELVTPERLLNIARERLVPYTIEMVGEPKWSTAYISERALAHAREMR